MEDKLSLVDLVGTQSADAFISNTFPNLPFVVHDLNQTLAQVTSIPFLASLDLLLQSWTRPVQAHLPDVADESSSVHVSAHDARKLFANGMGLLFNNVHEDSPLLAATLHQLRSELGLPISTLGRCMVYATPDGKGTATHFDQNINFVLKRWWLAANTHVQNPTQRFTIGQAIDPELAGYLEEPLPKSMPKSQIEYLLKPGSLLFVPRGYWHRTEAQGSAMALNFTFNQPTWADLFLGALRSRLLQSSDWRAVANQVNANDPERHSAALATLDTLLVELAADVPFWNAADILRSTEGHEAE
jgi:50S ribosomal protein L16 3-hydroxylase